jgi:hypothetical protein
MHGAGTTHIFHAALGQPNCCALVELFPDTTVELHAAQGYGNLARMLGLHHWRNVAGTLSIAVFPVSTIICAFTLLDDRLVPLKYIRAAENV